MSGCRAAMEPVGLTTKRSKNKYATGPDGELMLIHRCMGCATIVINRIAADDSAAAILDLFNASCSVGAMVHAALNATNVSMLTADDRDLVGRRLFGNSVMEGERGELLATEDTSLITC